MKKKDENIKQSKLPLIVSFFIILSLSMSYFFVPDVKAFVDNAVQVLTSDDEERITDWVRQFGFWGPVTIVIGMVAQIFCW